MPGTRDQSWPSTRSSRIRSDCLGDGSNRIRLAPCRAAAGWAGAYQWHSPGAWSTMRPRKGQIHGSEKGNRAVDDMGRRTRGQGSGVQPLVQRRAPGRAAGDPRILERRAIRGREGRAEAPGRLRAGESRRPRQRAVPEGLGQPDAVDQAQRPSGCRHHVHPQRVFHDPPADGDAAGGGERHGTGAAARAHGRAGGGRSRVERVVQHDLRAELREGARRDPRAPLSRRRRHADLSDVLRVRASQGVGDSGVEPAARRGPGLRGHAQAHAARAGLARRVRENLRAGAMTRRATGSPGRAERGGVWGAISGPPTFTDVALQRDGRVGTITIDRPADQNRLTREVLLGLEAMVHELAGDAETQAVVLTGRGAEFFSMGILNPSVRASYTKDQILELVRTANRMYDALEALPQIVIAALNGAARAGAAELSLACDIRLAAAHATFALPEALWGGFPGAGGPVRLPGIVGRARALEIMCTGRELDAAELQRLGLVLAVHPGDRLLAEAQALAARIAASGPLATRGAKRIVTTRLAAGFGEARSLSDALRYALEWSRDVDEGMLAHREGRAPRFTGR